MAKDLESLWQLKFMFTQRYSPATVAVSSPLLQNQSSHLCDFVKNLLAGDTRYQTSRKYDGGGPPAIKPLIHLLLKG